MRDVDINQEPVELYKILKFEGMVPSGGEAKAVVAQGMVSVNGVVETRKRKKIVSGDVILSFAGEPIDKMRDLPKIVAKAGIGETVEVKVWRGEAEKVLKITIGKVPGSKVVTSVSETSKTKQLGLTLGQPKDKTQKGVMVSGITSGSVAAERGITTGDIIKKAGNRNVSNPADIDLAIAEASKQNRSTVLFLMQKGEQSRYVALPIDTLKG